MIVDIVHRILYSECVRLVTDCCCFCSNSGWILTTTLVLSVMVLLWICCAAVATAVEQYVPPEVNLILTLGLLEDGATE